MAQAPGAAQTVQDGSTTSGTDPASPYSFTSEWSAAEAGRASSAMPGFPAGTRETPSGTEHQWPLGRAIAQSAKKIILSGQNADLILDSIRRECQEAGVDYDGLEIVETESYAQAVQLAKQMAKPGECVLFSPAGTSYDRYHHFEERGNHFRQLVAQLYES